MKPRYSWFIQANSLISLDSTVQQVDISCTVCLASYVRTRDEEIKRKKCRKSLFALRITECPTGSFVAELERIASQYA